MRFSQTVILKILIAAALTIVGFDAHAADSPLYTTVETLVTDKLGFLIGLVLAVWGIWTWVVKQETMVGLMMIVGGVLISISPGVMNFVSSIVNPVVKMGTNDLTTVKGAAETTNLLGI